MKRLDRWLSGEALAATPEGDWHKLRRWIRMHPRTSRFAVATLVGAVVVTLGSLTAYLKVDVALHRVSTSGMPPTRTPRAERGRLAQSRRIQTCRARWQDQQRSLQELEQQYQRLKSDYDRCQKLGEAADQRLRKAVREARLSLAEQLNRRAIDLKTAHPIRACCWRPKRWASRSRKGVGPSRPHCKRFAIPWRRPKDGALSSRSDPIAVMAASRDGNWLASGDSHGTVQLWSTNSNLPVDVPKTFHGEWDRVTELLVHIQ